MISVLVAMSIGVSFQPAETIRLWAGIAPGSQSATAAEQVPELTVYRPARPNGLGMIICPGGGYTILADHEGKDYAEFLNQHGVTCFVLRYRLGKDGFRHPVMLMDAQRAIRTVRKRAQSLGVQPGKIGIMGSSAGGHLAATASVHFRLPTPLIGDEIDRVSARPDFSALCYPVILLQPPIGHEWSGKMLLGENPAEADLHLLNPVKHVSPQTPPAFIWHTREDTGVPPENSELYAAALKAYGVPHELHLYETGPHGIGLNDTAPYASVHPWARELVRWLKAHL